MNMLFINYVARFYHDLFYIDPQLHLLCIGLRLNEFSSTFETNLSYQQHREAYCTVKKIIIVKPDLPLHYCVTSGKVLCSPVDTNIPAHFPGVLKSTR